MENILNLDLNDIVSKEVQEKINGLNERISSLSKENRELRAEERKAKDALLKVENFSKLFESSKAAYGSIESTPKDKDGFGGRTLAHNKYLFISGVMESLFKIKEEHGFVYGWGLIDNLILNFYSNKPSLIDICRALDINEYSCNNNSIIEKIKNSLMPYDYPKDEIIKFVRKPHYCTNGAMFSISDLWNFGKSNTPHSLLDASPFIADEDVFQEVLKTVASGGSSYNLLLYAIPKYNKHITDEHIVRLGETLIGRERRIFGDNEVLSFVANNLKKFNDKTLDYLFGFITNDNQFKVFHWEKFPYRYQCRYLMNLEFKDIKILFSSSCRWTDEEKETFLAEYFRNRKVD